MRDILAIPYVCPRCRGALRDRGAASWCEGCGGEFPIEKKIPRFLVGGNYTDSFGFQWNRHAKAQLDSSSGLKISRDRLFQVTEWPVDLAGQTILEAGSGAGRFTEVLLDTGAAVYSFDFSNAVDANCANNGHRENLNLFQASIYALPLPRSSFDKVICLGVLQHTPDPERSFRELATYLKPGGEIVVDVYKKTVSAVLQWKYVLRPFLKRVPDERLYRLITRAVDLLLPATILLKRKLGRVGARLVPIVEYSELGLSFELNREWAILDTFDMYSPAYDQPQTLATVRHWFLEAGLTDVRVRYGPNGIVGTGMRPLG